MPPGMEGSRIALWDGGYTVETDDGLDCFSYDQIRAVAEDMERIRTLIEEKRDKTIQGIGSNLFHKGDRV